MVDGHDKVLSDKTTALTFSEEPLSNCAYLYDGSLEGLFSAVFLAFERKESPTDIVHDRCYVPRLDQSALQIETDFSKAQRIRSYLEKHQGSDTFRAILRSSLCDDYDKGITIFEFIKLVVQHVRKHSKGYVLNDLAHPVVRRINELSRQALNEAEKMRQFVRFTQWENGLWVARCNPRVSVIPLIMGHFAARFNDQVFVIYDENHHISGLYNGEDWSLVSGDFIQGGTPTSESDLMEEAWRCFYDALCVDARYNPELRRNFMPKRFWRNLPEMQPYSGKGIAKA